MTKTALFIVAQKGYQPREYGVPKKVLEDSGVEVITASKKIGKCVSSNETITEATISISDVDVSDYDAIVFIGGPGAPVYQKDVEAHLTAQEAINRGKILAAICIAPTILAYADVLEGKNVTVWNEDNKQAEVMTKNGAKFVDKAVVVDGKIITANGPKAAEEFAKEILKQLK
ncbi:DJ-1 family protein [Candidatus Woesearchaeota archaeon CG_4_10_14_0_2_um_filter_33_13]|nr:MAG: DJ-1 family protein [Candidatus Woesearchaeota archaeon CG_4_10_14_0_2_um_filter_33_13]